MSTSVADATPALRVHADGPSPTALDEQIADLARTCGEASQPVWVHDPAERCVYRNRAARSVCRFGLRTVTFELLDHQNRLIGHLTTTAA